MINQQSAAKNTSSTKQHTLMCQLRTNTRPLALDRQTTTAMESGTTATTKGDIHTTSILLQRVLSGKNKQCDTGTNACQHWFLPWILSTSTYYHLCVAQLKNRSNLFNTTLEAPGTQSLAMLLSGFLWRKNRNHYLLLV